MLLTVDAIATAASASAARMFQAAALTGTRGQTDPSAIRSASGPEEAETQGGHHRPANGKLFVINAGFLFEWNLVESDQLAVTLHRTRGSPS